MQNSQSLLKILHRTKKMLDDLKLFELVGLFLNA